MDLNKHQGLNLGLSVKADGPMKNSSANRRLFFKKNNLDGKIILSAGLVHGCKVIKADDYREGKTIPDCDALITANCDQLLTITVADCLPLYFYDRQKKVVALAHAGWRGVVAEIAPAVIRTFQENYGSTPGDIEVFIGPHIQTCHFEVKADVSAKFLPAYLDNRAGKTYVNLGRAVFDQLVGVGLAPKRFNISPECTYCRQKEYFSWRRDKPAELEAMAAYIGLDDSVL